VDHYSGGVTGFPVVALRLPPANGLVSLRDTVMGRNIVAGGGVDHYSGGGAGFPVVSLGFRWCHWVSGGVTGFPVVALRLPPANGLVSLRDAVMGHIV
jgi:hypothetical protein